MRLPVCALLRFSAFVSGIVFAGGCAESQLDARLDAPRRGSPPVFAATAQDRPAAESPPPAQPEPSINLGFSRYVPPPLPWRRQSISLGFIGDWPLRTGPEPPPYATPSYTYASRPFACGVWCDPDYVLP